MTHITQKSTKQDPLITFLQDKRVAISSTLKFMYIVFLGISAFYLLPPNTLKGLVLLIATMGYKFIIHIIIEALFLSQNYKFFQVFRFADIANLVQGFKTNRINSYNDNLDLHQILKEKVLTIYSFKYEKQPTGILLQLTLEELRVYRQWMNEL